MTYRFLVSAVVACFDLPIIGLIDDLLFRLFLSHRGYAYGFSCTSLNLLFYVIVWSLKGNTDQWFGLISSQCSFFQSRSLSNSLDIFCHTISSLFFFYSIIPRKFLFSFEVSENVSQNWVFFFFRSFGFSIIWWNLNLIFLGFVVKLLVENVREKIKIKNK